MGITNTRIYLTNLGKYNEGTLQGEWVDLPIGEEELKKVFDRIGINKEYEEYFITDYETDLNITIGEYENIKELNETIEELEDLTDFEIDKVNAIIEYENYDSVEDLQNVISDYDDYNWYGGMSGADYEEMLTDDGGCLQNIPSWLENYITIDYESMADDDDIYDNGNGVLVRY